MSLATMRDMMSGLQTKASTNTMRRGPFVAVALLCIFVPFEDSHLIFMFLGALGYLALATLSNNRTPVSRKSDAKEAFQQPARQPWRPRPVHRTVKATKPVLSPEERRLQGVTALAPPTFQSTGWAAEVDELLEQITPTPDCDAAVAKIVRRVEQAVRPLFPSAKATGYVNGRLNNGKAFAVAVPDVDIVVDVSPAQLIRRSQKNDSHSHNGQVDLSQSQKTAVRACIERLVNVAGLKFRRSAFRSREPKVTFLAPSPLPVYGEAIPIDFSINSQTPSRNAVLIEELSQMEPLLKALTLLVRRWAKDRGICHAAKGNLPPYVWTHLCIYFLQAGVNGSPLVAPLDVARQSASVSPGSGASAADLFKGFMHFYAKEFDWCQEVISVRLGRRTAPDPSLAPTVLREEDGKTSVCPFIEDSFDQACNLGDGMTAESLKRLHDEFARADALCAGDASLAVLLEPWAPANPEKSEDVENAN